MYRIRVNTCKKSNIRKYIYNNYGTFDMALEKLKSDFYTFALGLGWNMSLECNSTCKKFNQLK